METNKNSQNLSSPVPDRVNRIFSDPQNLIPEKILVKEFQSLLDEKDKRKLTIQQEKRKKELETEIAMLYGLKNGLWIANISYGKYYSSLAKMRQDIVKEYDCKSTLEFMLADRIVANYWRAMRYESIMHRLVEKEEGGYSFDQLKVNSLKELHKGLESANRQLHTNMILLKQLKQPPLNIKIKAETAFVAQNQQINAQKIDEIKPYETIEPK